MKYYSCYYNSLSFSYHNSISRIRYNRTSTENSGNKALVGIPSTGVTDLPTSVP